MVEMIKLDKNNIKDIEVNILNPKNNFEYGIIDIYQKIQNRT